MFARPALYLNGRSALVGLFLIIVALTVTGRAFSQEDPLGGESRGISDAVFFKPTLDHIQQKAHESDWEAVSDYAAVLRIKAPALYTANRLALLHGEALAHGGRNVEALEIWQAFDTRDALADWAAYRMAEISLVEDPEAARQYLAQLLKTTPESPYLRNAKFYFAELEIEAGHQKKAATLYREVVSDKRASKTQQREAAFHGLRLELDPEKSKDLKRLVEFLDAAPGDDWSLKTLREWEKKPGWKNLLAEEEALAWVSARVLYRHRFFQEAESALSEYLGQFPDSKNLDEARYTRGRCMKQLSRFEEAREAFAAVSSEPYTEWSARAAYHVADGFRKAGDEQEAERRFQAIVDNPRTPDFVRGDTASALYKRFVESGRRSEARLLLEGLSPRSVNVRWWERLWFREALENMQHRDDAQARADWERVFERATHPVYREEAAYWLGRMALLEGDRDEAFSRFKEVLASNPQGYFSDFIEHEVSRQLCEPAFPAVEGSDEIEMHRRACLRLGFSPAASPGSAELPYDEQTWIFSEPVRLAWRADTARSLENGLARAREFRHLGLDGWALSEYRRWRKESRHVSEAELMEGIHFARALEAVEVEVALAERLRDRLKKDVPAPQWPCWLWKSLYPLPFRSLVAKEASKQGMDPLLLASVMREESRFKADALSVSAARGLMQFIPSTAQETAQRIGLELESLDDLYQPGISIALGASYLAKLLDEFGGNATHAVAAYNGGEGRVRRWKRRCRTDDPNEFLIHIDYLQTRNYVKKVMNTFRHYERIYRTQSELCEPLELSR